MGTVGKGGEVQGQAFGRKQKFMVYGGIGMSDMMIIPLRVPREVGRAWKVEAVKQDKSVQRWILDHMNELGVPKDVQMRVAIENATGDAELADKLVPKPPKPLTPPKQASVGDAEMDALVKSMQPTDQEWIEYAKSLPVTDEEVPEKRCFKCKTKVRVWTMTDKGPLCPDCKSQMEVSIP